MESKRLTLRHGRKYMRSLKGLVKLMSGSNYQFLFWDEMAMALLIVLSYYLSGGRKTAEDRKKANYKSIHNQEHLEGFCFLRLGRRFCDKELLLKLFPNGWPTIGNVKAALAKHNIELNDSMEIKMGRKVMLSLHVTGAHGRLNFQFYSSRARYHNYRIGGIVNYLTDPYLYKADVVQPNELLIDDVDFKLRKFRMGSSSWDLDMENPNFIHDFVFTHLCNSIQTTAGKSDMKLQGQSPDLILEKEIIELATTVIEEEDYLAISYNKKIEKYLGLSRRENKKLLVVVVSQTSVLSNIVLSSDVVRQLILSHNIALSLKLKLQLHGLSVWGTTNENESMISRKLDNILEFSKTMDVHRGVDDLSSSLDLIDQHWDEYSYEVAFDKILNQSVNMMKTNIMEKKAAIYEDHFDYVPDSSTRVSNKRVCNYPFFIPMLKNKYDVNKIYDSKTKGARDNIVLTSYISAGKDYFKDTLHTEMPSESDKEYTKIKEHQFKVDLNDDDRIELALVGVQAKEYKNKGELKLNRARTKQPLDYYGTDVEDIEMFRQKFPDLLKENYVEFNDLTEESHELMRLATNLCSSSSLKTDGSGNGSSLHCYEQLCTTKLGLWLSFISDVMFEINSSLRENTKKDFFIVKPLRRFKCNVYIKTTNSSSHIFYFLTAQTKEVLSRTLGPKLVVDDKDGILTTEWASFLKRDVENGLNLKDGLFSVIFAILDIKSESFHEETISKQTCDFIFTVLMIKLSNKSSTENLITDFRYIIMKSLSLTENPTSMLKKYPTMFRSRLDIYFMRKIVKSCYRLEVVKFKFHTDGKSHDPIEGLEDIYGNSITLKVGVNFQYSGYFMTKLQQMQKNQAYSMVRKVLDYELEGLKLTPEDISVNELNVMKPHAFDYQWIRTAAEFSKKLIVDNIGRDYDKIIDQKIKNKMNNSWFSDLSTLKASAKMDLHDDLSQEALLKLKEPRPRVVESCFKTFEDDDEHYMDKLLKSIQQIDDFDKFNVELFPKDQHAGLREIYVVDFRVRIIQFFMETISRSLCENFSSETMNNKDSAQTLTPKLINKCMSTHEVSMLMCKSGDASKWSQSQIVSKFYICLKVLLPIKYHHLIKMILSLWFRKKIFMPAGLIENILLPSFETREQRLNDLIGGSIPQVYEKGKMFLRIRTGFMQGILHHTSSIVHTVVQEFIKAIKLSLVSIFVNKDIDEVSKCITFWNLQGSDDSFECFMCDMQFYNKNKVLLHHIMHFKDSSSFKFGIIPSKEKTASCVPYLYEYNSQWNYMGQLTAASIKFSMVATQIPSSQSLLQRQEFYYGLLKDCVEKGLSTFCCSCIKLCQLSSYYNCFGSNNVKEFKVLKESIIAKKNPSFGFFILEPLCSSGVFGFDFSLYLHHKRNKVFDITDEVTVQRVYELMWKGKGSDRKNIHISKMNWSKWRRLIKTVGDFSEEDERMVEEDCYQLYYPSHNFKQESLRIKKKLQDFEVKVSLASKYGVSENMASFFLTFTKVCKLRGEKHSLIEWHNKLNTLTCNEDSIKILFPRHEAYDEIIAFIEDLEEQSFLIDIEYVPKGFNKVEVLRPIFDFSRDMVDVIIQKWFGEKMNQFSLESINYDFKSLKDKLPWLKDTERETRELLGCSSTQLSDWLKGMSIKSRRIFFQDSSARGNSWRYMLTRVFKPKKKIVRLSKTSFESGDNSSILSNIKLLVSFPFTLKYKIENLKKLTNMLKLEAMSDIVSTKWWILRGLLHDVDHHIILSLFKKQMSFSPILYYSQPQTFDKITKLWHGEGKIVLMYKSVVAQITILDESILDFQVNNLDWFLQNFYQIHKSLKSDNLRLLKAQEDNHIDSDISLRITPTHTFNGLTGTSIRENSALMSVFDRVRCFDISIENGNIRVKASLDGNGSKISSSKRFYRVENPEKRFNLRSLRDFFFDDWVLDEIYNIDIHGEVKEVRHFSKATESRNVTLINYNIRRLTFDPWGESKFDWGELANKLICEIPIKLDEFNLLIHKTCNPRTPLSSLHHEMFKRLNISKSLSQTIFNDIILVNKQEHAQPSLMIKDKMPEGEAMKNFLNDILTKCSFTNLNVTSDLSNIQIALQSVPQEDESQLFGWEMAKTLNYETKNLFSWVISFQLISLRLKHQFVDKDSLINFIVTGHSVEPVDQSLRLFCIAFFDTPCVKEDRNLNKFYRQVASISEASSEQSIRQVESRIKELTSEKFNISQVMFMKHGIILSLENKSQVSELLESSRVVIEEFEAQLNDGKYKHKHRIENLRRNIMFEREIEEECLIALSFIDETFIKQKETTFETIVENLDQFQEIDPMEEEDLTEGSHSCSRTPDDSVDEDCGYDDGMDYIKQSLNRITVKTNTFLSKIITIIREGPTIVSKYLELSLESKLEELFVKSDLHVGELKRILGNVTITLNGNLVDSITRDMISDMIYIDVTDDETIIYGCDEEIWNGLGTEELSSYVQSELIKISSDPGGSCLFNALSEALKIERNMFLDTFILRSMCFYHPLPYEDKDLIEHKSKIMDVNEWGQETDIMTICKCLNFSIEVLGMYGTQTFGTGDLIKKVSLFNHHGLHFDLITKNQQ